MSLKRFILIGILATSFAAVPALAGYTAGGTFVVKSGELTIVDNGGVICKGMNGNGIGGGCLPFPVFPAGSQEGGFVGVLDNVAGSNVAFQVCIDNNGDGICGGNVVKTDRCPDQIFFSHADGGKFFNALGPLPTHPLDGCTSAFNGYIVLLCEGAHNDPLSGPHTHQLSQGIIFAATSGSGFGNFCGGNNGGTPTGIGNTAAKAYRVV